jgi:hypothetical protein
VIWGLDKKWGNRAFWPVELRSTDSRGRLSPHNPVSYDNALIRKSREGRKGNCLPQNVVPPIFYPKDRPISRRAFLSPLQGFVNVSVRGPTACGGLHSIAASRLTSGCLPLRPQLMCCFACAEL